MTPQYRARHTPHLLAAPPSQLLAGVSEVTGGSKRGFSDSGLLSFFRRPNTSSPGSSSNVLQHDLLGELGLSGTPTGYRILGRQGVEGVADRGVDDLSAFKVSAGHGPPVQCSQWLTCAD